MHKYTNKIPDTKVVGNTMSSDESLGFKEEIKDIFESYMTDNVNLAGSDFLNVISSPISRRSFIDSLMESTAASQVMTNDVAAGSAFYRNYTDRLEALTDNSLTSIARESAMIGYAPITAYTPFFLKKQWVNCVFKDVLMAEVPSSPLINIGFVKRYLKDMDGTRYEIPDVFYKPDVMKTLVSSSTGLAFDETNAAALPLNNADVLTTTYIPDIVVKDRSEVLTADFQICKVRIIDKETVPVAHDVPVNIKIDVTTHNFVSGKVSVDIYDSDGVYDYTVTDEIVGNVDYANGKVTVLNANAASTDGKITHVFFRGKTANRFNERSLNIVRENVQHQFVIPESGPRINTEVTIEDAADALALQRVDQIADNIDIMGQSLAQFEDSEIRRFLMDSYNVHKEAGVKIHGFDNLITEGTFDALPYNGFSRNVTEWMKDAREYFERIVIALKDKLKTPDAVITAVAHPSVVRFLQDGINWIFNDDTNISGLKVDYSVGVITTSQDRCHIITSRHLTPEDGIRFYLIPTTKELITFKHYKYNTIIDRNYRNPVHTLTPNIMATHRTLTVEVLPVQGCLKIDGRELNSPTTLERS